MMDLREKVARAICEADPFAPDPDARITLRMKQAKAWEARLPMADAAIAVITGHTAAPPTPEGYGG